MLLEYRNGKMLFKAVVVISVMSFWRTSSGDIQHINHNHSSPLNCRCLPGDPCWPSKDQWNSLNVSLNGRLVIPHPTAYPCYGGTGFNAYECQQTQRYYDKPHFLYKKPGSMLNFRWEDLGDKRCSLEGAQEFDSACHSGSTPAYAVDVHTVKDIQTSLAFANQHNLRVVIKSTGHDTRGRSTAPGALLLWMHHFQGELKTKSSFTPNGCNASRQSTDPVITVTGGKIWEEVVAKVEKVLNGKYAVLAGLCTDVGAAGGYSLGGGYGILSPSFGLAVDDMLETSVVTASGKLLVTNACRNKDLFWALRGGGGGTFGVVTSVTYRLHSVPNGCTAYSFVITNVNKTGNLSGSQVEDILEVLFRRTPELENAGWTAFCDYAPKRGYTVFLFVPADRRNATAAAEALKNELVTMQSKTEFLVQAFPNQAGQFTQHFDTFEDWRTWAGTTGVFDVFSSGYREAVGNRLIPLSAVSESRKTAQTLLAGAQKNGFQEGYLCALIVGDGVRNRDRMQTSVTPAWRSASWICHLSQDWNSTTSNAEIAAKKRLLNSGLHVWRDAYPDSGSYLNEAFDEEPNWQQAFWGSNYERLLRIKSEVDPNGLFMCNRCVGSEVWDQTGNCRVS